MGQEADSRRHASLDEKKERAAGRRGRTGQYAPGADQIRDLPDPAAMQENEPNTESTAAPQGKAARPVRKRK
jgi:hypothetical protein